MNVTMLVRSRRYGGLLCALTLVLLVAGARDAQAQSDDKRWGIGLSFAPQWKASETLQKYVIAGEGLLEGAEFSIGVERGRTLGGTWGVRYVQKAIKSDTRVREIDEYGQCSVDLFCGSTTIEHLMDDASIAGAEVHFSIPFATFGDRVQVGINVAGGVGFARGTVTERLEFVQTVINPVNGAAETHVDTDVATLPASDAFEPVIPLGKLEAQVGVIAAPGLKLQFSGGLNMPSQASFRVALVYLFGG